jgi:hypothetical protein
MGIAFLGAASKNCFMKHSRKGVNSGSHFLFGGFPVPAVSFQILRDPLRRLRNNLKGTSINSISTAAGYKRLSRRWTQLRYCSE